MRFPHHPAQEVGVCSTEVWVILSPLQRSAEYLISPPLGMRSICMEYPSQFVLPSYLWPLPCFSLTHGLAHTVSSCLSGCSACVINRLIISPLRSVWFLPPLSSLLVGSTLFFLNGFPDELGHFSQEASVGPNSFLFTRASVCSMRRATSDNFLPVALRVRPMIPEHYLTVWAL